MLVCLARPAIHILHYVIEGLCAVLEHLYLLGEITLFQRRKRHLHVCRVVLDQYADAVAFVGTWSSSDEIAWFPKEAELRSGGVYVYPWSIYYHGRQSGKLAFALFTDT